MEEAIDLQLEAASLGVVGPGVRLLVVASPTGGHAAEPWLARLGWLQESAAVVALAPR